MKKNIVSCPWGKSLPDFSKRVPTPVEKNYIGYALCNVFIKRGECTKFLKSIKLSKCAGSTYKHMHKKGKLFREVSGRPSSLDNTAKIRLKDYVENYTKENKEAPTVDLVTGEINKLASETLFRNGVCKEIELHDKTVNKLFADNELLLKNAQSKSKARVNEENNVLNGISTFLMWKFVSKYVNNPALVINFDSTQYCIGGDYEKRTKVVVTKEFAANGKPISSSANQEKTNSFSIKYYCICTQAGHVCENLVFIIADARMNENDFYYYKVPGLSTSTSSSSFGYICFCKTRCPKEKFFMWFVEDVLIEFVKNQRRLYSNNAYDNAFISCDGEIDQIKIFLDENIRNKLNDENIIVGKLPASTTAVAQACDAGHIFSSTKAGVKILGNNDIDSCVFINNQLDQLFKTHNDATVIKYNNEKFNASHKSSACKLLTKSYIALSTKLNSSHIRNSFTKVGISKNCEPDLNTIMKQFNHELSNPHYFDILAESWKGIAFFEKYGSISDNAMCDTFAVAHSYYKESGINNNIDVFSIDDRDELALSRRRSVIVTQDETLNKWVSSVQQKIEDARQKKEAAAVRIKVKETKEKQKKDATEQREADIKKQQEQKQEQLNKKRKRDEKLKETNEQLKKMKKELESSNKQLKKLGKKNNVMKTYCVCRCNVDMYSVIESNMVCCHNNESCNYGQWFHYKCIGKKEQWKPNNTWHCFVCKSLK